jgi:hypothetical protein
MRRIPAAVALLALAGGLVAMTGSPASAAESEAAEASDLIEMAATVTTELVQLVLDANVTVAGTGVIDATVTVGP